MVALATANEVEDAFQARIAAAAFPCVGAKTALSRGALQFVAADNLQAVANDAEMTRRLQAFAGQLSDASMFESLVVTFRHTPLLSEPEFEDALWARLQAIHELDARSHGWDAAVSSDPASPHFSMSVGGRAFFVIGLHPGASRKARQFPCSALVFNPHSQFEQLRSEGRFEKIRAIIAKRDRAFSGSVNPMLAVHGDGSDAPQYSGRQVNTMWQCPFKATARA